MPKLNVRSKRPAPDMKDMPRSADELGDPALVAASLMAKLQAAVNHRDPWQEEWRFAIRAWFQVFSSENEDSWESQRYMPIILKHVETALPSIVSSVLDSKGIFRCSGMTRKGKEAARAMEKLVNWQARTVSGAEEAYEDMFWWAALLGTAYLDHYWLQYDEVRTVADTQEDPVTGQKRKILTRKKIRVADHPKVECLNPMDVYPDPMAVSGDDLEWYIMRVVTTVGALRDAAGKGHIDGKLLEEWFESKPWESAAEEAWADFEAGDSWEDYMQEIGYEDRTDRQSDDEDELTDDKPVVVLKYVSKKETITLASGKNVIGYSPNPFMHGKTGLVIHHFFKVPDSPFGRGLGGILRGHQELGNENVNAWMDTVNLERMAPIIVDKNRANLMDDELTIEPNAIIRTRGVDAVQRLQLPAPTNLAMTMDQHIARDADDLTGFSEQARGLAPNASQTATAFSGIQSNLRTRLVMHVRRSSRTIQRSGSFLVAMNQQFYSVPQVVQIVGEDGLEYVEIAPEEIVGEMVVDVSVSTSRASPESRAQRLLQLLQVVVPLLQGGLMQDPTVRRMVRMVLDANEVEDVDLLLPRGSLVPKKDPLIENELLKQGIAVPVGPKEEHSLHAKHHQELLQELLMNGAPDTIVDLVKTHLEETFQAIAMESAQALQAAQGGGAQRQQMQGASGAGVGPGGGDQVRQGANLAGAATGGQGIPGVAAPGPSAPGRVG